MDMKNQTVDAARSENAQQFLRLLGWRRQLETVSGFDENEDMTTSKEAKLSAPLPFNENLAPGQVRLLSQSDGPFLYVALLRRWEEDSFLVTPFSPYPVPATDEEFQPQYDGGVCLRTLQSWNTRTLQDATLKKSWLVTTLSEADRQDAFDFWCHTFTGKSVEERLLRRSGTPILSEDDPRIEYMSESMEAFALVDAEDMALAMEPVHARQSALTYAFEQVLSGDRLRSVRGEELAMAAAPATSRFAEEYVVLGADDLKVTLMGDKDGLTLVVHEHGRRCDRLSGAEVVLEDGAVLGRIEGSGCSFHVPPDFNGCFGIREQSGHVCSLAKDE